MFRKAKHSVRSEVVKSEAVEVADARYRNLGRSSARISFPSNPLPGIPAIQSPGVRPIQNKNRNRYSAAKAPATPTPTPVVTGHAGTTPIIAMQITAKSNTAESRINPSTNRERVCADMAQGNQGRCNAAGCGPLAFRRAGRFRFQTNRWSRHRGKQQLGSVLTGLALEEGLISGRTFSGGQELNQNPFFQQAPGTLRKGQKLDAGLPHGISPGHAPRGFETAPRVSEIEAEKDLLVHVQRSDRLNRHAGITQIADDAAVGLIQIDVGQALNLVAVVMSSSERCQTDWVCVG